MQFGGPKFYEELEQTLLTELERCSTGRGATSSSVLHTPDRDQLQGYLKHVRACLNKPTKPVYRNQKFGLAKKRYDAPRHPRTSIELLNRARDVKEVRDPNSLPFPCETNKGWFDLRNMLHNPDAVTDNKFRGAYCECLDDEKSARNYEYSNPDDEVMAPGFLMRVEFDVVRVSKYDDMLKEAEARTGGGTTDKVVKNQVFPAGIMKAEMKVKGMAAAVGGKKKGGGGTARKSAGASPQKEKAGGGGGEAAEKETKPAPEGVVNKKSHVPAENTVPDPVKQRDSSGRHVITGVIYPNLVLRGELAERSPFVPGELREAFYGKDKHTDWLGMEKYLKEDGAVVLAARKSEEECGADEVDADLLKHQAFSRYVTRHRENVYSGELEMNSSVFSFSTPETSFSIADNELSKSDSATEEEAVKQSFSFLLDKRFGLNGPLSEDRIIRHSWHIHPDRHPTPEVRPKFYFRGSAFLQQAMRAMLFDRHKKAIEDKFKKKTDAVLKKKDRMEKGGAKNSKARSGWKKAAGAFAGLSQLLGAAGGGTTGGNSKGGLAGVAQKMKQKEMANLLLELSKLRKQLKAELHQAESAREEIVDFQLRACSGGDFADPDAYYVVEPERAVSIDGGTGRVRNDGVVEILGELFCKRTFEILEEGESRSGKKEVLGNASSRDSSPASVRSSRLAAMSKGASPADSIAAASQTNTPRSRSGTTGRLVASTSKSRSASGLDNASKSKTARTATTIHYGITVKARNRLQWRNRYKKEYEYLLDLERVGDNFSTLGDLQREAAQEGMPHLLSIEAHTEGQWFFDVAKLGLPENVVLPEYDRDTMLAADRPKDPDGLDLVILRPAEKDRALKSQKAAAERAKARAQRAAEKERTEEEKQEKELQKELLRAGTENQLWKPQEKAENAQPVVDYTSLVRFYFRAVPGKLPLGMQLVENFYGPIPPESLPGCWRENWSAILREPEYDRPNALEDVRDFARRRKAWKHWLLDGGGGLHHPRDVAGHGGVGAADRYMVSMDHDEHASAVNVGGAIGGEDAENNFPRPLKSKYDPALFFDPEETASRSSTYVVRTAAEKKQYPVLSMQKNPLRMEDFDIEINRGRRFFCFARPPARALCGLLPAPASTPSEPNAKDDANGDVDITADVINADEHHETEDEPPYRPGVPSNYVDHFLFECRFYPNEPEDVLAEEKFPLFLDDDDYDDMELQAASLARSTTTAAAAWVGSFASLMKISNPSPGSGYSGADHSSMMSGGVVVAAPGGRLGKITNPLVAGKCAKSNGNGSTQSPPSMLAADHYSGLGDFALERSVFTNRWDGFECVHPESGLSGESLQFALQLFKIAAVVSKATLQASIHGASPRRKVAGTSSRRRCLRLNSDIRLKHVLMTLDMKGRAHDKHDCFTIGKSTWQKILLLLQKFTARGSDVQIGGQYAQNRGVRNALDARRNKGFDLSTRFGESLPLPPRTADAFFRTPTQSTRQGMDCHEFLQIVAAFLEVLGERKTMEVLTNVRLMLLVNLRALVVKSRRGHQEMEEEETELEEEDESGSSSATT